MQANDVIPPEHPVFPGHFAGRPIVPGAMLIGRVIATAACSAGFEAAGVRRAKFLRVLGPGEPFRIELSEPSAAGLKFRVVAGDGTVAEGQLVASAPPPA